MKPVKLPPTIILPFSCTCTAVFISLFGRWCSCRSGIVGDSAGSMMVGTSNCIGSHASTSAAVSCGIPPDVNLSVREMLSVKKKGKDGKEIMKKGMKQEGCSLLLER